VYQAKDFKSELKPIWCPGCGDYGGLQGVYRALANIGRPPHEVAFVSGIGCSSRIPGYTSTYGFNTVHEGALFIAQGIKLARPELLVLAAGGDGDGFSIGGGRPALHPQKPDITYLVMDNHIYGLTKGARRRRVVDWPRLLQPFRRLEEPVNPRSRPRLRRKFVAQGTPAEHAGARR
jgi:2-oxoglutarate ferredoxin oxidoreductase subunit beta